MKVLWCDTFNFAKVDNYSTPSQIMYRSGPQYYFEAYNGRMWYSYEIRHLLRKVMP